MLGLNISVWSVIGRMCLVRTKKIVFWILWLLLHIVPNLILMMIVIKYAPNVLVIILLMKTDKPVVLQNSSSTTEKSANLSFIL